MSLLNTLKFITNHPVNQQHKLNALVRFAKWQIGSRLVPGTIIYDWINGSKFLVRNGETGLTGNIYAGLHEFSDMAFLLHFLRSEDLFIDVGANVGSYTILACSVIGARGIAFEPVPETYHRLIENMRLNRLDTRVECINKCVGSEEGFIDFTSDSDTTNHVLAPGEQCANTVSVKVTSLDMALQNESPILIKIDVEGFEASVIAGAHDTLQKQTLQCVIMELNGSGRRYGFNESQVFKLMANYDFGAYSYNPLQRMLINVQGKNQNSGNTLFIRDRLLIEKQVKDAPKIKILNFEF